MLSTLRYPLHFTCSNRSWHVPDWHFQSHSLS